MDTPNEQLQGLTALVEEQKKRLDALERKHDRLCHNHNRLCRIVDHNNRIIYGRASSHGVLDILDVFSPF